MDPITDAQKAELRSLLLNPVLQQAFTQATAEIWDQLKAAPTVEAAALNHKIMEGAIGVLNIIHQQADVKKAFVPQARRTFKPETPIV